MMQQFDYGAIADSQAAKQLGAIITQCFNSPPNAWEIYAQSVGLENFRVIRQAGQMAGGLALLKMGQWYGGKCVSMAGIASVGIAPEYRGVGAAIALINHTLQELYADGISISVLYPAAQHLYRKAGYEQAGSYCRWESPTQTIRMRDYRLPMQPMAIAPALLNQIYKQQAQSTNGYLERHSAIWQEVIEPQPELITYGYLLGTEAHPEGYIVANQKQVGDSNILEVRDAVLLTTAAIKRFWTFLSDHRSQIAKVQWRQSPVDSLTLLLSEQSAKVCSLARWMVRIVDVSKALVQRGYPPEITAELHLEVTDDLLPENNGKFLLNVANGEAEVTKGGRGDLRLDVRGLAPLYTGLFTPQQLQMTGQLEGAASALATATKLFTSTTPWMPDFF